MIHVYLSLITYNSHEQTLACLRSLDGVVMKNITLHITVVDNASEQLFSLEHVHFAHIKPTIIRSDTNTGFSGGHNIALRHALAGKANYILILNNDVTVDREFLVSLVETAEADQTIGIVCPKIYFAKGSEFHKERYQEKDLGKVLWYAGGEMDWNNVIGHHRGVDEVDDGIYNNTEVTDMATGCCMLVRASVIERVALFDERYFLYYEDADLSERVNNAGFTIVYAPKAFLWHANAGSTGGSGSALQDYFISRNRMLFGMRYAPARTKAALIKESYSLLRNGREWQKKGVWDFYMRKFGKGSFGL